MNTRRLMTLVLLTLVGGCDSQPKYIATPFFSEKKFAEIRPGMNEEHVRGLLGYPASRFGPITDPSGAKRPQITWDYAVPASWEPPMTFRVFSVTFGPNGVVSGKLSCDGSWAPSEGDGARRNIEAVRQSHRRVGDLVLVRPDGSTNVLRASSPDLYLVLLDGDVSEGPRLNPGPSWLSEELPDLLRKKTLARVKHLYVGHRTVDYEELVKGLPPETARECYAYTEPEFNSTVWDSDSRMVMYKTGVIWSAPPDLYGAKASLAADDLKWLINRLGTKSDGGEK